MTNNWQSIWNGKKSNLNALDLNDEQHVVIELKRLAGYDFFGKKNNIAFSEFKKEYEYIRDNLGLPQKGGGSVFEVGCGAGPNLYFFHRDGFEVGGSDYAENLLAVVKKIIGEENLVECISGEASELPVDIKYDAVFSGGVFPYFNDFNYAEKVLDRMVAKAKKCVASLRMLQAETREDYLKYRREHVKNYDELYKDLPKLFIPREFFINYAAKNNLKVQFPHHHIEGYWNNEFNFDCFLYKE